MHWDADAQTCVITPPSVVPDAECALINLQELAEGYQILLAENAAQDDLILALQDSLSTAPASQRNRPQPGTVPAQVKTTSRLMATTTASWASATNAGSPKPPTTTYLNGDAIPEVTDGGTWASLSTDACDYENNLNNMLSLPPVQLVCGNDVRSLCPSGWYVPTDGEWTQLRATFQPRICRNRRHSAEVNHGLFIRGNGTDDFGRALPGGFRVSVTGSLWKLRERQLVEFNPQYRDIWYRAVDNSLTHICRDDVDARFGFSIRCVKD